MTTPETHPARRPLALVTGVGRTVGIGAAVVRRLVGDGWDVAFTFHGAYDERVHGVADDAGRETLLAELTRSGARVAALPADLSRPEEIPALCDAVAERMGGNPTALVMSHCESVDSGLLDTTVASFDLHYAVNVRATWLLVREFALRFPAGTSGGRIIAMTSDHTVGNVPYGATKGAMDRLVLAAAKELAHLHVTANVINPGPTDTGWMSPSLMAEIQQATPSGRLGRPEDAAHLVSFLCSERGQWINGQLLMSNGGFGP